jgi:hypothetical protein
MDGLQVIGRYGAFKYNNQDHSILMGRMAAENILTETKHNLWNVNTDYETVYVVPQKPGFVSAGDRVYRNSDLTNSFAYYNSNSVLRYKFKNNYNRSFVIAMNPDGSVSTSQQCP